MRWWLASIPLPASYDRSARLASIMPDGLAAALQQLRDSGHRGLVVTGNGRGTLLAGGMPACRPRASPSNRNSADPTGILAAAFADLASPARRRRHSRATTFLHPALPRLAEALSNLGFGRDGAYAIARAVACLVRRRRTGGRDRRPR